MSSLRDYDPTEVGLIYIDANITLPSIRKSFAFMFLWRKSPLPHRGFFGVNASPLRCTFLGRREFFDLEKKSLPFANEWAIIANRRGDAQPGILHGVMTVQVEKIKLGEGISIPPKLMQVMNVARGEELTVLYSEAGMIIMKPLSNPNQGNKECSKSWGPK